MLKAFLSFAHKDMEKQLSIISPTYENAGTIQILIIIFSKVGF